MNVFEVFAKLGFNGDEFVSGMNAAEQRLRGIETTFNSAGRTLTAGLTAPIVGVATGAIAAATTYETAFAGVQKTVNASETEFAALSQGIREMSLGLPATTTEIAAVAEAAGQLGIEQENILAFTRVMIDLGETTNLSSQEAAMALARFMNVMGTSSTDVDRIGSTIAALGNDSATTEAEIVALGQRLTAAGVSAGLSETDVLAFASTLTSVGINAEAGGTALSKVFRSVRDAVIDGNSNLDTFAEVAGVTVEQFAAHFQEDAAGAISAFINGLGEMSAAGESTSQVFADLSLTDGRLIAALESTASAGSLLNEQLDLANTAWDENTALQDEATLRYETTESQLKILGNHVADLAIELGEVLLPIFREVIEGIKPLIENIKGLVQWFGNLDEDTQKTITTVGGIAAALGPVLLVLGSLAGAISNLLPLLGLLLSPIGLVVAAIAAITWAFATDFMGIRTAVVDAWNAVVDAFERAWKWIQDFFAMTPREMLQFGKDLVSGLVDGIIGMAGDAVDAIKGIGTNIMEGFKGWLGIASPSTVFYGYGEDIGEGLAQGIEASTPRAVSAIEGMSKSVMKAFTAAATFNSGSGWDWSADNIIGGFLGDLEGQDALNAMRDRVEVLQRQQRGHWARGGSNLGQDILQRQIDTFKDEIAGLARELRATREESGRQQEVQTARFSRAVDQFDSGVRGMTLARQRY